MPDRVCPESLTATANYPLQLSVLLLLLGCWPSGRLDTAVPSTYTRENHCVVRCVVITHHH